MATEALSSPRQRAILQGISYVNLLLAIGWAAYQREQTELAGCASAACGFADLWSLFVIMLIPFGALLISFHLTIASFRKHAAPRTRRQKVKLWLHLATLVSLLLWGVSTFVLK